MTSLQIYFFCVKRQAKNFPKDVKSTPISQRGWISEGLVIWAEREKKYLLTHVPWQRGLKSTCAFCAVWWVFVPRVKKFCVLDYPKCGQWRFWSNCANAQSDLNLRCAHMYEDKCSDVARSYVCNRVLSLISILKKRPKWIWIAHLNAKTLPDPMT